MVTSVILVRHGQTEWNRLERFRGHFDIPLNETGLDQAEKTAREIKKYWNPSSVYASPLTRAKQTAQKIAYAVDLPVQISNGVIDINYGEWQGLTKEEAEQKWPELITDWFDYPERVQIPGGESLAQVRYRARSTLDKICSLHQNQEIVIVSHTVVNRLILLDILGLGNDQFWQLRQEPCGINIIEKTTRNYAIVTMNDFHHIKTTE